MMRPWEKFWTTSTDSDFMRSKGQLSHPSRLMIANMADKIGGSVLECGCATALDYPLYVGRGLPYSGIDITPQYIHRAKELYPRIDARIGTVLDLPWPSRSKSTVYCRALLAHLHPDEWKDAVREMWRVTDKLMILCFFLKPGKKEELHGRTRKPSDKNAPFINRYSGWDVHSLLTELPDVKPFTTAESPPHANCRIHYLYMVPRLMKWY